MADVSIQELKRNLSAYLARAEAGEALVVTRHGRPVVRIAAFRQPQVVIGPRFGKTRLSQVVRERVGEAALRHLQEDRRDRFDDPKGS
ncbi:MAG: type II toxin-antitoxin system prevent-host-death family antitoxin [Planctomycetes bacterium]|nr:type II toxin-antitoxin system prevent-host-death family antitoxin [Planctomycetota bacterium]